MEPWQIALLTAGASFAAQIGGILIAVKFLVKDIGRLDQAVAAAHKRIDGHLDAHARV